MKPITTTLKAIRKEYIHGMHNEQTDWKLLLQHLGKTEPDDEPLPFSTIIQAVGVRAAYNCLDSLAEEHKPAILRLMADVAERVLPVFEKKYPDDKRPREAIQAVRDFADGKITEEELEVKKEAAWIAANDISRKSGWDDARHNARAAAWTVAWAAAWGDPWIAAREIAREIAPDAAWDFWDAGKEAAKEALCTKEKIHGELLTKCFG